MTTAIYVAIIEGTQDEGYSAFFPDLPGCVTAAETMLELPAAARDALSLHLAGMIEDGELLPEPTAIEATAADPEVKEAGRILVDVDVEDAPVRVNISIGAQFLKRVDVAAEARGMTRSGFLVEAARRLLVTESRTVTEAWDRLEEDVGGSTELFTQLDTTAFGRAAAELDAAARTHSMLVQQTMSTSLLTGLCRAAGLSQLAHQPSTAPFVASGGVIGGTIKVARPTSRPRAMQAYGGKAKD